MITLRWLWLIFVFFGKLRTQKSTAPASSVAATNPIKEPMDMSTLLAAIEAEASRLASEAETALNSFTEKYLGQSVSQLGTEATAWYADFQAAKTANNTKAWATLASQTAEMIDAQAKQIAALQTQVAAGPNAVIAVGNDEPAQPAVPIGPVA